MRALVQLVQEAKVEIEEKEIGKIGYGFLVFLGVGKEDGKEEANKLWEKIKKLRIFPDSMGKTNLNLEQVGGELLVVSQFTLYANAKKGNRPSFTQAAPPDLGEELYEYFLDLAKKELPKVQHGQFGGDMQVHLINDGPFTIWLDTDFF